MQFDQLAEEALKLAAGEREAFIQLLLASLEEEGADDALADEVERRSAELEEGGTQALPLEDALAQVRARLK